MPPPIVFQPAAPGRVVRRLPPAPVVPVPAPGPGAAPVPGIGVARSPAWQFGLNSLAMGKQQVDELISLRTGISGIGSAIGAFSFPTEFSVSTQFSDEHQALLTRGVEAIELLAESATAPPTSGCADLDEMSDLAFSLNARINNIASWLMDRSNVTLSSVLKKLTDFAAFIQETEKLVREAGEADAAELIADATESESLRLLVQSGADELDPHLFDELNRRAALLLAAQCLVASHVEGVANDWPPVGVTTGPVFTAPAKAARKARPRP